MIIRANYYGTIAAMKAFLDTSAVMSRDIKLIQMKCNFTLLIERIYVPRSLVHLRQKEVITVYFRNRKRAR